MQSSFQGSGNIGGRKHQLLFITKTKAHMTITYGVIAHTRPDQRSHHDTPLWQLYWASYTVCINWSLHFDWLWATGRVYFSTGSLAKEECLSTRQQYQPPSCMIPACLHCYCGYGLHTLTSLTSLTLSDQPDPEWQAVMPCDRFMNLIITAGS